MILLWGLIEDEPTRMVFEELHKIGAQVFFLNHRDIDETHVSLKFDDQISGTIRIYGRDVSVEEISSCYLRTYNILDYPENDGRTLLDERIQRIAMAEDILWSWV